MMLLNEAPPPEENGQAGAAALKSTGISFPDLCHKCGRCCRSAITPKYHDELLAEAAAGDKNALDFLRVFEPFESVEAAMAVQPDQISKVMQVLEARPEYDISRVTFYHCRFVTPEGLCGIYDTRPNVCKNAPYHGFTVMPPNCGFEGWQFLERERQMRIVRDLKQSQFQMKVLAKFGSEGSTSSIDALDTEINARLKDWACFGAEEW